MKSVLIDVFEISTGPSWTAYFLPFNLIELSTE